MKTSFYFVSDLRSQTQAIDWSLNWWERVTRNTESNRYQLKGEKNAKAWNEHLSASPAENVYECRTLSVINNLSSDLVEDEEGYLLLTNSLSNVSTLHTTCSNSCILHHSVPYGPHHRHISYLQEYSHFLAQKVLQATQLYCILTSTARLNTKCLTPETETSQISPVMPGMSAVYWQFLRCPWPTTM